MNIQSIIAEVHARADSNGDGKLTSDDLDSVAADHGLDKNIINALKKHADANGDGKISPDDVTRVLQNPKALVDDLKELFSGTKT